MKKASTYMLLATAVAVVVLPAVKGATPTYPDPHGFTWGVATAAYQIEGATTEDGRGPSIWDTFSSTLTPSGHNHTDLGDDGSIADDSYHKWDQDIALMKELGVSSYRFSIAWPRIFPSGEGEVNKKGLEHYSVLIDALIAAGIEPLVTMYHWDLPQSLDDKYGGWLSRDMDAVFMEYARVLLEAYGDRVSHWITFNEPWTFCVLGYDNGSHAPGRCSDRETCFKGDSSVEPYECAHNVLRSHGFTAELFQHLKEDGVLKPDAKLGMALNSGGSVPFSASQEDADASDRSMIFTIGWFADPLYTGDYDPVMRKYVGGKLPKFTMKETKRFLDYQPDFFAINHYTSGYVKHDPSPITHDDFGSWFTDQRTIGLSTGPDGTEIGVLAASPWLRVVPWGIRTNLNWLADRYKNPPVLITENGCDVPGENDMDIKDALHDSFRVDYYRSYTDQVMAAVHEDGVNVIGYFMWSLEDNFEWADGYAYRFGIVYVDYINDQARYAKDSFRWAIQRILYGGIDAIPPPGPKHAGEGSRSSVTVTNTEVDASDQVGFIYGGMISGIAVVCMALMLVSIIVVRTTSSMRLKDLSTPLNPRV